MAREQRRLAAIVAADVVGYSRLMEQDENGTLAALRAHRSERIEPALVRNGGRVIKLAGDGSLIEFGSAVDALRASIEFQQAIAEANSGTAESARLVFRVGLHLGDLVVDGHDLYGDAVNIAARLEGAAPPGGILISRAVHEAVDGRLKARLKSVGELSLKNIERPIAAFEVEWRAGDWPVVPAAPPAAPALALPEKPSIAVLPFQNLSGDPEQEYFADGMADDITTELSRFKSLFVIARNSSFAYKGKSIDTRQIGRELGVRYVLEGSVRKSGTRVRISGQLVEADSGVHLWAERFDGSLDDVFELQDSVTTKVVGAITHSMHAAETERARRKPVESLDAYDCYLRGMACLRDQTIEKTNEALALARRAIGFDAGFIPAYGLIARCHALRLTQGWMEQHENDQAEIRWAAQRVSAQGQDDAVALAQVGQAMAYVCLDVEAGRAMIDAALAVNQNLANAWAARAQVSGYYGEHETTLSQAAMALRLSPLDSERHLAEIQMAWANFFLRRYDEAMSWAQRVLSHRPHAMAAWLALAIAQSQSGRTEEARATMAQVLRVVPDFHVAKARERAPYRRSEDVDLMLEGLRLAGLPE
ncbi:MAG TPA: adenylate/guanylate cyclase domain-containing protein [Reyranella sp.]|nr:adenylate/guanylate cyclase domain-containing protein [Reyranella sp.]